MKIHNRNKENLNALKATGKVESKRYIPRYIPTDPKLKAIRSGGKWTIRRKKFNGKTVEK